MIRAALFGWALPVSLLGLWYALASNDISFGVDFFSRAFHDQVFGLYGSMLGLDPATIPGLVMHAILVDSLIVVGLVALRHQRAIRTFVAARLAAQPDPSSPPAMARSLSSAP